MVSLIRYLIYWCVVGAAGKILFLIFYSRLIDGITMADWWRVVSHGMRLDVAIAGYVTLPAVLMYIVWLWTRNRHAQKAVVKTWQAYTAIVAVVTSVAYTANIVLYKYWGFPLDNTPLLYLKTSPADAMASATAWQIAGAVLMAVVMAVVIYKGAMRAIISRRTRRRRLSPLPLSQLRDMSSRPSGRTVALTVAAIVMAGLLIIPIRGGLSTGTNHTGSVYFSTNIRLNHAAVNPIFSFLESVNHQQDIASMYRFMDDKEATRLMETLVQKGSGGQRTQIMRPGVTRPDIAIIILESFSTYIMDGGEGGLKGVTPNLNALAGSGVSFKNFYASSFRTDRALLSILSSLPAQPTMSLMDMPGKSTRLPSIARSLGAAGYRTTFYYGGDADYSNMRSYLMGTGFQNIVSETDFPRGERTGKWGVPDLPLLMRVAEDEAKAWGSNMNGEGHRGAPELHVVLTGSSHEPFDVPHKSRFKEPELNAFNYADMALGEYVRRLKEKGAWDNTLLIILPDHLGAYPPDIDNLRLWRYHLPLIMTGGAVAQPRTIGTIGCQADLAATLLASLGIRHDDFLFSKDMLSARGPHFAFFTMPDGMGLVTPDGALIHDNHAGQNITSEGDTTMLERKAKAYLQKLYDYINGLESSAAP